MRIALIHTPLTVSQGGERQVLMLAIELQKMGHEVEIFTEAVDYENCFPNLLSKVKVNVCKVSPMLQKLSFIGRGYAIGKQIPDKFDIINCHNYTVDAAYFAKRRLHVPIVWMCNEPPIWWFYDNGKKKMSFSYPLRWLYYEVFHKKVVANKVDRIIVLNNTTKERVRKIYNRESTIIRTGIDVDFFKDRSGKVIREKYGLDDDILLLQVGSIGDYRRQSDSVKALSYISHKFDNVKLIFVTPRKDDPIEDIIALADKLGVKDKIMFFKNVDDDTLAEIYAASDIFVFPADLSWGLVVIEAMASSKPVVVSDKVGASEIIKNGENGIIFPFGHPEEMAKEIEKLINDPGLRKSIGRNARKYVENNLSWEAYAKNMLSVFYDIVENRR